MQTGEKVEARVKGVSVNRHVAVNGRNPRRIQAEWQDPRTGGIRLFESRRLWTDPSPRLTGRETVPVWVDPSDSGKYVMDLSFLSEEGT